MVVVVYVKLTQSHESNAPLLNTSQNIEYA